MISAADIHAASLNYTDQHGHIWSFNIVEKNGARSAEVVDLVALPPIEQGQQTNSFHYVFEIPEKITDDKGNEYRVTGVADGGFYNNDEVHIIAFPASITRIGNDAFNSCANLVQLGQHGEWISKGLKTIGERAFVGCGKLKEVRFSKGSRLESIGEGSFARCGNLVFYGGEDTCAEEYAANNGIEFVVTWTAAESGDDPGNTGTTDPEITKETVYENQTITCRSFFKAEAGNRCRIPKLAKPEKYLYKSMTPKVATVSKTGVITILKPGKAKIKVTCPERTVTYDSAGKRITKIYKKAVKYVTTDCRLGEPVISAKALPGKKVRISWNKGTAVTGYKLYIKFPGKKKYKCVLTKSAKIKAVTHKGLKAGRKYSYKVKAYHKEGSRIWYSDFSQARTVTVRR